ncbi:hypothetical protein EG349_10345 [Chryseobacterium shandongense]|uniref:DUF6046 domain-containing protein n=2 Tax=Chryseobacterium TaxID=59732 RepID=A0AAD0YEU3_9FLAO|nr:MULTISPECIES: DUF6046 domain-containing protein [Chryseobacterium]AZA87159.1 hypothetical protein EG349_10345 [Chryseobacterium shandongense]AZA95588.1 hypothetical protein EG353_08420 [Chryseobacterium shandongense]MEC3876132.1 DUF6046 domain-containing protein [Chryseobacterium sp. T9W2-O]
MDRRIEIAELFKLAFGVSSPVYLTVPIGKQRQPEIQYSGIGIKEAELPEAERLSRFGTPIVFPLMFKGNDYQNYDIKGKIIKRKYEDFWFPPATMVDFSQSKNITRTDILGGNGTVKEIFGFEDWSIRIRTLCITDEMSAREYEKNIVDWSKIVQSIAVESDLFMWKGIDNIVIDDIDIKSVEGTPNVIPIELQCSSDEPFELIYKSDKK